MEIRSVFDQPPRDRCKCGESIETLRKLYRELLNQSCKDDKRILALQSAVDKMQKRANSNE